MDSFCVVECPIKIDWVWNHYFYCVWSIEKNVITILFHTSCGLRGSLLKRTALVLSILRKNYSPKCRYCAMHTESRWITSDWIEFSTTLNVGWIVVFALLLIYIESRFILSHYTRLIKLIWTSDGIKYLANKFTDWNRTST